MSGEFLQVVILSSLALLAAAVSVAGLATGVHLERYVRQLTPYLLVPVLLAGFALSTAVSKRNTSLYGLASAFLDESNSAAGVWILRAATATVVLTSVVLITATYLYKISRHQSASLLFLAFCIYFVPVYLVSGIFGTELAISHKSFYPLLVVFALYVTSDQPQIQYISVVRDAMLVFLLAGLCMLPIAPDLVLQRGYSGPIPGFNYRYWGLASHANNIGPLSIFFLLILKLRPYTSRSLLLLAALAAAVTLLLSQSKTAYGAAVLIAAIYISRYAHRAIVQIQFGRTVGISVIGIGMLAIVALLTASIEGSIFDIADKIVDRYFTGRSALTGREQIWNITISEWRHSPIFGFGPNLWGTEFSARNGYLGIASNAHSQIIDTLGTGGILGVTGLVVYFLILVRYAVLLAPVTNWTSVALVALFAARCLTEVPLKSWNITTSDFFMHAFVLGLFMRASANMSRTPMPPKPHEPARPDLC